MCEIIERQMIKTGNKELDSFWKSGLHEGGFILLTARPGMGKTHFLLSLGQLISKKHKTLMFSLEKSAEQLKRKNITDSMQIDDTIGLNSEMLTEKIAQVNPEVVLIDYLQLIIGNDEKLIQDLKNIAVNTNICIIVSSQLSRELEYRPLADRRPIINDLTASGTCFNDTTLSYIDNITFLYSAHYYNPSTQNPDVFELIQYKNGNTQIINVNWNSLNIS